MSKVTEEDRARSKLDNRFRKTAAYIPMVNLVNAARRSGWYSAIHNSDGIAYAGVDGYRVVLMTAIVEIYNRMLGAEARVVELEAENEKLRHTRVKTDNET